MKKEHIEVTSAQKELLELLTHKEVYDYFESLKMVHYLATYCVGSEMVELSASRYTHDLLDAIQKIVIEKNPNLLYKE
ncbi:MAG: hypothetical protein HWD85_10525 [Flavobacteriaceae bacterium]|nr:hypothetical protein [Flavobacteriaceae bacterium]